MKTFLIIVLVLAVCVGALGYQRGWFSVTKDNVEVDSTKFKHDKEAFSKTVGDKTQVMKERVANLWKKTEGMTGDEKARAQKELEDLKIQHDRLEHQIKELGDAGQDRFDSIKQDLSTSLDAVEKKIEELTRRLEKGKDK